MTDDIQTPEPTETTPQGYRLMIGPDAMKAIEENARYTHSADPVVIVRDAVNAYSQLAQLRAEGHVFYSVSPSQELRRLRFGFDLAGDDATGDAVADDPS